MERRLSRARDRLDLLYRLGAEQLLEVQRLEQMAHPVVPEEPLFPPLETEPEPEIPALEASPIPDPPEEQPLTAPEVALQEEEHPMEPAGVQLSRLLGLPQPPTTRPGSPS
jgi:hypothetical protein